MEKKRKTPKFRMVLSMLFIHIILKGNLLNFLVGKNTEEHLIEQQQWRYFQQLPEDRKSVNILHMYKVS